MTTLYTAGWVIPAAAPAIRDGAIAVEPPKILAVGPREELAGRFPQAERKDFGDAAILPGLVNCHSHLELSAMRGFLEPEEADFFAWLAKLTIARLFHMTAEDLYVSAALGAVEAARAGVTTIADASDSAITSMSAIRDVGLRGIVYQETFGPDPRDAEENVRKLREKLSELRHVATDLVGVGVSPHAPYTVSAVQLGMIAELATAESLPVMMHAAEPWEEQELLLNGTGSFADGFRLRGIDWNPPGLPTVEYLAGTGILKTKPLLAHCINVNQKEIEIIRETGCSIAHCPKSNAKLNHGVAPFSSFLKAGIPTGFGSDSVASNNTCDIVEEARFATLLSRAIDNLGEGDKVSAEEAIRTATLGGARALGLDDIIGSLEEGKQADLAVISLSGIYQQPVYDPVSAIIFSSSARDVLLTVVAGKEIFSEGLVRTADEASIVKRVTELSVRLGSDSPKDAKELG